jgi:hypothetical protein
MPGYKRFDLRKVHGKKPLSPRIHAACAAPPDARSPHLVRAHMPAQRLFPGFGLAILQLPPRSQSSIIRDVIQK